MILTEFQKQIIASILNNEITDIDKDTFIRLGAYLYQAANKSGKNKITFIVPKEFQDLPMWSEQLFEESLGKDGKGVSIFYEEDIYCGYETE